MKIFSVFFLSLVLFSVAYAGPSSLNFELENPIIVEGGGESTSLNFKYLSTTSQLTQGQSTSLNFGENAGFLYFPFITVPPPDDEGGGGGGGGGGSPGYPIPGLNCRIADFNCDGKVNILDLSILLYYLHRADTKIAPFDLKKDGVIDLGDISIMFYYWDKE